MLGCTAVVTHPVPAGLFLLERLRPQLDIEVSQALARMAPLYHGSTHRKSVDKTTDSAAGITAPKHKRISKQQRAAWVRQHLTTLKQQLKQQLAMAELLLLPKGCSVAQESHVMLLQGSIQVRHCLLKRLQMGMTIRVSQ